MKNLTLIFQSKGMVLGEGSHSFCRTWAQQAIKTPPSFCCVSDLHSRK